MILMQGESEGATLAPSGFPPTFKWEFFPLLSGEKGVSLLYERRKYIL